MSDPSSDPTWIPEQTQDGSWTLVHGGHGEACHSRSGAWLEAWQRYAVGCRLPERARAAPLLRVLDVGTGLGFNLAAALKSCAGTSCELALVSLELERSVVEAALALPEAGEPCPWEPFYHQVLQGLSASLRGQERVPLGPAAELRLMWGDARQSLGELEPGLRFDAVFLDPFSPPNEPGLWNREFLEELAGRMAPGSWLATYSAAFKVRERLGRAGLRVGLGPRVGAKSEGTLASPDQEPPAFSERLQRRLARVLSEG